MVSSQKGPICHAYADRALLAGYPRNIVASKKGLPLNTQKAIIYTNENPIHECFICKSKWQSINLSFWDDQNTFSE